jgi:tetratricopeptide (TPR) repeat protein
MFSAAYPMGRAALYYGWYGAQASGPFAREDFHFSRGAVACHIHSTSAASLRDPRQYWVAPLIARGAAAALGNVYEPFLALTPQLDVFNERLRAGFTFAESAYMSQRVVSWMTTFVGDPLYRPFRAAGETAGKPPAGAREWIAYRTGALLWFNRSHKAGAGQLRRAGGVLRSGMIFEGLGLLQLAANDLSGAAASFQQARKFYTDPNDAVRTLLHQAGFLKNSGNKAAALALVRKGIKTYPNASGTAVLQAFESELAPPPSPAKNGGHAVH